MSQNTDENSAWLNAFTKIAFDGVNKSDTTPTKSATGLRCPINNTGSDGNTFAQAGVDDWLLGAINYAVVETYKARGRTFAGDDTNPDHAAWKAKYYKFDLVELGQFVNFDMMYGYSADARRRNYGDGMSFRGYPTPIIKNLAIEVARPSATTQIDLKGFETEDDSTTGGTTFIHFKTFAELKYPLPFDFYYSVTFSATGYNSAFAANGIDKLPVGGDFLIKAGETKTSHVKETDSGSADYNKWVPLLYSAAFFQIQTSEDSDAFTSGDITATALFASSASDPIYNEATLSVNVTVPDTDYAVVENPTHESIGVWIIGDYYDAMNFKPPGALGPGDPAWNYNDDNTGFPTCKEIDVTQVSNPSYSGIHNKLLYAEITDPVDSGADLGDSIASTAKPLLDQYERGKIYLQGTLVGDILTITDYIETDSNGAIIKIGLGLSSIGC